MPRRIELCNLGPFVFGNFIDFTLFGSLVRVLGAHGEQEVLSAILKSLMQMGKLVARTTIFHACTPLNLISLLINHKAVRGNNCSNFVFFLLSTDAEHLVVDLDGSKIFRQDF